VGTPDAFMTAQIGYNVGGGEPGTPKSLHDEYRRNTPVVYYAADLSFMQSFRGPNGDEGIREVDKAFAMYNSVGKVSQLDINDYPEDSRRVNFQANALQLSDLKSTIMGLVTVEVGLFEPSRWVWMLTLRQQTPGAIPPCPFNMNYDLQQRNFTVLPVGQADPPTSSYVNGVLYSYYIYEHCTGGNPLADAIEMPVDPVSSPYSAVADFSSLWYIGLQPGQFYTSLTRDDVAGMKYLYNTNNFNREAAGPRTTEFVTNDVPQIITTQDLGALAAAAKVNNAAALQALFPGLTVTSSSNYFGFQITTNITQLLVNSPYDPAGAPPSHPVVFTNFTTNIVQFFVHSFGNIVTNTYGTLGLVGTVTQNISNSPYAPAGSPATTNTVVKIFPQTGVFGDFFILPTNTCGAVIISNMLPRVTATTNLPSASSNAPPTGSTNAITFIPGSVTFATNNTLLYLPVTCPIDALGIRGGMDQIQFVRRDYDAITGQVWDPVTNDYTLVEINETNHTSALRHFQRVVPQPDFLFTAADLSSELSTISYTNGNVGVTITFTITGGAGVWGAVVNGAGIYNNAGKPGNQAGPGTILASDPVPTLFIFNSQFPSFANFSQTAGTTNTFLYATQDTQSQFGAFAAFDGTTNAPLLFPNGTSFLELQNLFLGPANNTPFLPNGNVGLPYSAQLSAKGGTPPYTFALAPTSPGLPGGLNLSSDGKITGIPSGPASIYDFTVRITDSAGKYRDVQFTITIF
jgi:hypothetical protein